MIRDLLASPPMVLKRDLVSNTRWTVLEEQDLRFSSGFHVYVDTDTNTLVCARSVKHPGLGLLLWISSSFYVPTVGRPTHTSDRCVTPQLCGIEQWVCCRSCCRVQECSRLTEKRSVSYQVEAVVRLGGFGSMET